MFGAAAAHPVHRPGSPRESVFAVVAAVAVSHALLPLWLKLAFTGFILVWLPLVVTAWGWQNLLWLCDLANLIVLIGLWLESRLLLSSQLVATLVIGLAWTIDLACALALGVHPFAATPYLFDASQPLAPRLASFFHVGVPLLLLYVVSRLGHDRRGWQLQTVLCWIVLPLSAWLTNPVRGISRIDAPFGFDLASLPAALSLLIRMVAYPLVLYLPAEALLRWLFAEDLSEGRSEARRAGREPRD